MLKSARKAEIFDTEMLILIAIALVNGVLAAPLANNTDPKTSSDPEIWMTCAQIIQHWGYPVEQYEVTTDDGYILTIFRIPHGRNDRTSQSNAPKPVVFFQHGLESSSYDWIANLPNEAAGFLFADNGFDVWLGNFRGNMHGKKHVKLTSKQHEFWKFSWDEMAEHDLPAMIDKVLLLTKAPNLYYVGHSMGTTAGFASFARNKELGKKIKTFYALAPVTTVKNIKGPLKMIAPMTNMLDNFFKLVGYDEFMPNTELTHLMADLFCSNPVTGLACSDITMLICGPESHQMNITRMPVYMSHTPAGTSTQTVAHYGQEVENGKFEMFDFGGIGGRFNIEHYGQATPPMYDTSQIEVPIYLFWSDNDWLADPKDVQNLIPHLKKLVGNVYLRDTNHLDFVWGLRASEEIYWPIINHIRQQTL